MTRPVESLRCGGLPAGWDDPGAAEPEARWDPRHDDGTVRVGKLGGGVMVRGWARVRRCQCGSEVLAGSPADRQHEADCGKPGRPARRPKPDHGFAPDGEHGERG
jgi:hypothetical protein